MSAPAEGRAPGLVLGDGVRLGEGVSFGAHVVVHEGTVVGARCAIGDHAVLGRRPRLSGHSRTAGELGPLVLGAEFAAASVGDGSLLGEQSFVRERSTVGAGSVIGRGSALENDVLLGQRARVQSGVYLTAFTVVEDDVFIGPGVLTTNDDTMSRHSADSPLRGPVLRRACRVGGGAVLCPGVEVGEEAFVAAGAVVTRDVAPRTVVMGVPARAVREVPPQDALERWR